MRKIKRVAELSLLKKESPVVLLASSSACVWCDRFKPIYNKLAEEMEGSDYTFVFLIVEDFMCTPARVKEYFFDQFQELINATPTIYIIDDGISKVPLDVLWSHVEKSFDIPSTRTYLIEQLNRTEKSQL